MESMIVSNRLGTIQFKVTIPTKSEMEKPQLAKPKEIKSMAGKVIMFALRHNTNAVKLEKIKGCPYGLAGFGQIGLLTRIDQQIWILEIREEKLKRFREGKTTINDYSPWV